MTLCSAMQPAAYHAEMLVRNEAHNLLLEAADAAIDAAAVATQDALERRSKQPPSRTTQRVYSVQSCTLT